MPLALGQIVSSNHPLYHLLVGVGLLGLVASFNGIILASGRALFEMGRVGFLPHFIGHTLRTTKTPAAALLLNLVIGIAAILFLNTGGLITMSAFGAVTLYVVSMLALLRLRKLEPDLARPYRTPLYPLLPLTAIVIATGSLATMCYYNFSANDPLGSITLWYLAFIAAAFVYFFGVVRWRLTKEDLAHFQSIE